jgi:predicted MFS family arabinose efflux permease
VTNIFANQPLIALIGPSLGIDLAAAGLVSTLTLLGYASGLFFVVPLADLLENRALVFRILVCASLMALATALAPAASLFLAASFFLGMASSVLQILVPLAAGMAPESQRGQVVGEVMSGVMLGILLSRPLASLVADSFGWRAFYGLSCVAMGGWAWRS